MLEKAYTASVRGKVHKKNKMPNQDYSLVDNSKYYTLAVVCDGLGSKRYSHFASRKLCKTIKKEVKNRFKQNNLLPYEMLESIQNRYKKKLWPFNLKNSDTTCLFAIISRKNILLFQLGDGIVAISSKELILANTEEKDFTNETIAFGNSRKKDWKFKIITKEENQEYKLLLCTDGISEDIFPETMKEFIDDIANKITGNYKKNKFLINLLKNWPNKYSTDDKSITVVK